MIIMLLQVALATATLQGKVVVWGSTTPIAQVEVELRRVDTNSVAPIVAVTTTQGEFRFPNVPPGQYRLIALRPGFTQAEYRQRRPGAAGSPVVLSARQRLPDVTLSMAPGGTISGRMSGRDGQPVQRATVQAFRLSYIDGRPILTTIQSTLTDDRGEYRLFWLPPGRYYVSFRPIGSQTLSGVGNPGAAISGGAIVANPNGPDTSFGLSPLTRSRPVARSPRPTNLEEHETYLPVYFPGMMQVQEAAAINVRAGEETRDVSVNSVIAKTAVLRVNVVDSATGQSLSAAGPWPVSVTPLFGPSAQVVPQILDNLFIGTTFNLAPGIYAVQSTAPGNKVGRVVVEMLDRDLDVTVLLSSLTVSGRVLMENAPSGFELQKHQVILRSGPAFRLTGKIAADGTFRIEGVPIGDYQVVLSDEALREMFVKSIRMGQGELPGHDLRIASQPQEPLEILLAGTGGELNGTVVNERKQAISEATVVLIPNIADPAVRLDLYKTTTADSSGKFQIRGIAPGEYSVYAWEDVDTGAWLAPNFIGTFRNTGTTIRVANGEKLTAEFRAIP